MRSSPTPLRANNDANADPVAPHPTIATRPAARRRCPSAPMPRNRICREYRSSNFSFSTNLPLLPSLKEVTSFHPQNLYYKWLDCSSRQDAYNKRSSRFIEIENGPRTLFAETVRVIRHNHDFACSGRPHRIVSGRFSPFFSGAAELSTRSRFILHFDLRRT